MALLGQASGAWTESSSALRILHVGIRNTTGTLTDDAFTQSNPVNSTSINGLGADITSDQLATLGYSNTLGVLSGAVAFVRDDNQIGGPSDTAGNSPTDAPLGIFINNAAGNAFENTPGVASDKGPYCSAQGTYANALFESQDLDDGTAVNYSAGDNLVASYNGYLTSGTAADAGKMSEGDAIVIAVLKMPADATQNEIVYDQRI